MTTELLLQQSASDALWDMATVAFYIGIAAAWAGYGYYKNNRQTGEELEPLKALPVLIAGALVGLAVVSSGQALNSEYVLAITGFLIPLLDKIWKTVRMSYGTASEMYDEGESIHSIALEIAQIIDREVDQGDVEQVITEYERRFGKLDPSRENVQERSKQLRDDYESGGIQGAIGGAQQPGLDDTRVDEPVPDVGNEGDRYELAPPTNTHDDGDAEDGNDIVRDGP